MKIPKFELADWIIGKKNLVKHNLSLSGIKPPKLEEMGIEVDYRVDGDHHGALLHTLSKLYDVPEENILVTTSGSEVLFLTFGSLIEEGDEVLVHTPNYPPMFILPSMFGAKVSYLSSGFEDRFELDVDAVEDALTEDTKLFVPTNSNNPTERIIEGSILKHLVQIADDHNVLLVVDETFRQYAFEDPPPLVFNLTKSSVGVNTISKFYGLEDLRIGWIFAEKSIIERAKDLKNWTTVENPKLSEMVANIALQNTEKFIQRAKRLYQNNAKLVDEWIEGQDELGWIKPNAGLISFPKFNLRMTSLDLGRILVEEYGVLIASGIFFGLEGHFRLCFTQEPREVEEALEALGKAFNELADR